MEREALRTKIFSKIDELPTLPVVLPRLLNLMESENSDAFHIAQAISHDPALTSKILKVANSAYYGFSQEICSLDRAIPLLGLNMVRSLALSIGVMAGLPNGDGESTHLSREGLWIHSLAVATAVRELAKKTGENNEHLFVVGLLHDIGKIVLDQFFNEPFGRALEAVRDQKDPSLHVAERNIIGMDHGEIGDMLLKRWKFPAVISDPISVHHQTVIPEGINQKDVALLRVADTLSKTVGFGNPESFGYPETHSEDILMLGLDEQGLAEMKDYLTEAKDGIVDFFGALT
jgi:putative nucleotidyltransferase with HDIG domain